MTGRGRLIVLFEPWNLGDALIAASIARLDPHRFILACNSRWHEVLMLASGNALNLLPLDLPYVWRSNKKFFSLGDAASLKARFAADQGRAVKVISIRGDARDWFAAHRIFPKATFSFTGWRPFLARKLGIFDRSFAAGDIPVRNRYHAWSEATGTDFSIIEQTYMLHREPLPGAPVVVHVGAQWRSKQYPHVAELADLLRKNGKQVEVLAGPDDPLPSEIPSGSVQRPGWHDLIQYLKSADHVICNDSGPMHIAAYLGCRTVALSRCSNIQEWLPPGAKSLSSPLAPGGYRPIPDYCSDKILPDWPEPREILPLLGLS
jgi:ADP-heptose:LPS heptosyltransferase